MSLLRKPTRRASSGLIEPCLPTPAARPPNGDEWVHEIKHDGFRIFVRRDGAGTRLISRNGHDFTSRFPLVVLAAYLLPIKSFVIDGELVVCREDGCRASKACEAGGTTRRRSSMRSTSSSWTGRREPLVRRKERLARALRKAADGLQPSLICRLVLS